MTTQQPTQDAYDILNELEDSHWGAHHLLGSIAWYVNNGKVITPDDLAAMVVSANRSKYEISI